MKVLAKYLLALSILFSSAYADEERIASGTRQLSDAEKKEFQEIQKQDLQKNESKKNSVIAVNDNYYPPVLFENDTHNIIGISALGDYLVIEDGSQWKIKSGYDASLWQELDPILIVENDSFLSSWFSGYTYKMINAVTNTFIEVKLSLGPVLDNPNTIQLAGINPITYEVLLSDGTYWKCDPSQYYLFNKWLVGDGIIIGKNIKKGWFSSYENILINVNMLQNIRSQRLE